MTTVVPILPQLNACNSRTVNCNMVLKNFYGQAPGPCPAQSQAEMLEL